MSLDYDKLYPEHAKMKAIKDEASSIARFLTWLHEERKPPVHLFEECFHGQEPYPVTESTTQVLAEYFKIDLRRLAEEKDQMVNQMRAERGA